MCPRCGSRNLVGPDEDGDMVCLDCGYAFDQDEIKTDVHKYLLYKKRKHTTSIRLRDHLGVVVARKTSPPFSRRCGTGMRNVDWWERK